MIDGSFEGLLTAVFEWFERKPGEIQVKIIDIFQPDAFAHTLIIHSDPKKAERVLKGLQRKLDPAWMRQVYCAYLSEKPSILEALFHFIVYVFQQENGAQNFGNAHVLAISQIATKVEREKHRMEAFIRFQHTADGIFYCGIDPDFNVLPLITKHFKNRYADQQWIIYDLRRKVGIYYNLNQVEEITFVDQPINTASHQLNSNEVLYQQLWQGYFKHTNIEARKNTKLHIKHVPKRYWKYLTEKFVTNDIESG